jgi:hypothetical protein
MSVGLSRDHGERGGGPPLMKGDCIPQGKWGNVLGAKICCAFRMIVRVLVVHGGFLSPFPDRCFGEIRRFRRVGANGLSDRIGPVAKGTGLLGR